MSRSPLSWAGAFAFVTLISNSSVAQPPTTVATTPPSGPFTLDLAAAAAQDVPLTVQSPSRIPFKIIHTGGPLGTPALLDISPFVNDQGVVQLFTVSVGTGAATDHVDNISFENPVLTANLNVPPNLPAGGTYTGRLILTVPGMTEPIVWRFLLTSANGLRPATLVLDRNSIAVSAIRPFCLPFLAYACVGGEPATVTVHVRDKTGNSPLNGVTARLESGSAAPATTGPDFEPSDVVAATFDGKNAGDIFASPQPGAERNVPARGQGTITLTFSDMLAAGAYTIPLRFTAANSTDDDMQRLSIVLSAHDSVYLAIFVLVLAACLSFLATRVVTTLRQRAHFLTRLRDMRPDWLAWEPPTLPVIGLRAMLRQAEDLSRRFWLTGQTEIDARLTAAARLLTMLDRIRQVRDQIEQMPDPMMRYRATAHLDEIIDPLDATPPSDQQAAQLNTHLDQFSDWFGDEAAKQEKVYWDATKSQIDACLLQNIRLGDAAADKLADEWREKLKGIVAGAQPPSLDNVYQADDTFRRLKILLDACRRPVWIKAIVGLHPPPPAPAPSIEDVYRVADDGWWVILNASEFQAEGPLDSDLDQPEAYDIIRFSLRSKTASADDDPLTSFLMRKKLTYLWTISITPSTWYSWTRLGPRSKVLKVRSIQPVVAQYSPYKGRIAVTSVEIAYSGHPAEVPKVHGSDPARISASSDFSAWQIIERADAISFVLAMLVSVVSGIKLYALGPTFGSLADYLALFTWGASVDQGKNFLQSIAAYASDTPASSSSNAPSPSA